MKTTLKEILNNRRFILTVQIIGRAYFVVMFINLLLFYNELLLLTPLGSIIVALIAFMMAEYKVDITKMNPWRRRIEIAVALIVFLFLSFEIMNHPY